MPKVRRVARRKKYRHTINRKKLNRKMKKLPTIPCAAIKEVWDDAKSVPTNMRLMGLTNDPNSTFSIPSARDTLAETRLFKRAKQLMAEEEKQSKTRSPNIEVAERLEQESKERKRKCLRLSQMQVDKLAYYIEKHGQDYQAMTRDRMNYEQNTWKQLRAQIKKFMECKEQWDEYWKSREMEAPSRSITMEAAGDSD